MDPREVALFEAFAIPTKRRRYADLVATKRGRDKVRLALDHFVDLDPRFCKQVAPSEQNAIAIVRLLKADGAPPTCYVMSSGNTLDGREMQLDQALTEIVGSGLGTFISCIPRELAYFEGEAPGRRYICRRDR